jgi:D-alanyl-D-alanine carboxypeptidase
LKHIRKCIIALSLFLIISSTYVYASAVPEIIGKAGITIDVATGEMIYTKDIDNRLFPASTTKLMTAIILAENNKPEDLFTYSKEAKGQEPYTISFNVKDIPVNDKITAADAMDAMLIPSANDIAYMIGENIGGGNYKAFIDLMNKKAEALKLKNTHFVTANGLHDSNHYSTAYDLSVIAREATKYPWIMNSLLKKKGQITTQKGVVVNFESKNKLFSEVGYIGGKTGYTSEAGRCLVAVFEIGGRRLVGVVLKSYYDAEDKTVFEDMKRIINWSYNAKKEILIKANSEVKNLLVGYSLLPYNLGPTKNVNVSLHTKVDIQRYVSSDKYDISYSISPINPWKLNKESVVGSVTVTSRETKNTYPLYTSISRSTLLNNNRGFYIIVSTVATFSFLALATFIVLKKRHKIR